MVPATIVEGGWQVQRQRQSALLFPPSSFSSHFPTMKYISVLLLSLCVIGCLSHSSVIVETPQGPLSLTAVSHRAIRVQLTPTNSTYTYPENSIIIPHSAPVPLTINKQDDSILIASTSFITVIVDKQNDFSMKFTDADGNLLLAESSRTLTDVDVDGVKAASVRQSFHSDPEEQLFGLGSFQDNQFNLRGVPRRMKQVNTQISIPFLLSNKGYGLLWHQYGLVDYNIPVNNIPLETQGDYRVGSVTFSKDGSYRFFVEFNKMTSGHLVIVGGVAVMNSSNYWTTPASGAIAFFKAGTYPVQVKINQGETPVLSYDEVVDENLFETTAAVGLDYVVFAGPSVKDVLRDYASLSGKSPLLPRWAFGFWQCRERYATQAELIENAQEYRNRSIPVDIMVQDWQYWPSDQWAGMVFDSARYPDPKGMVEKLTSMDLNLIISVWENVSPNSDLGKMYTEKGYYLQNSPWIDIYRPDVQNAHWNAMHENLFNLGMGGWWMDATEPENDALENEQTYRGPGKLNRNLYSLHVSQAVFEGQVKADPERRPVILTRSAFAGQQRFAPIVWSGDIASTWDFLNRQVVAGLNYAATGMPFWTTDIGGFFRPGNQYTDPAFIELLTRWYQFGTFNSIFRIHGYGTQTEVWRFGESFEHCARKMLDLRYRLQPYIYSESWLTFVNGVSIMRPLLIDYQNDPVATSVRDQFSFGSSFLVAPVLEPGIQARDVYLPIGRTFYDFWSGKMLVGGAKVSSPCPIDEIPLYVPAGSILPLGPKVQYTSEQLDAPIELRIYPGADGKFLIYEDAGEGWGYMKGEFAQILIEWKDDSRTLSIHDRLGRFDQMIVKRTFNVVIVDGGKGAGIDSATSFDAVLVYEGNAVHAIIGKEMSRAIL